jgi:hypothetical protein
VSDVFTAWTVDVARLHGYAHAVFVSCGAFGNAVLHSPPPFPCSGSGSGLDAEERNKGRCGGGVQRLTDRAHGKIEALADFLLETWS